MSDRTAETHPWRKEGPRPISVGEAEEIDRRCDQFESAWRRGESPRHEDFLQGDGPFRAALQAELIAVELEWRRRPGAVPISKAVASPDIAPPTTGPEDRDESRTRVLGALETIAIASGPIPRVLLRDTDGGGEPPLLRPDGHEPTSTRYRIDGEIARGGMGAVLKGRDPDLGRDVALKVLREEFGDDVEMVRRFVEEAQIGGQLQHPGIVPIYELGTLGDHRPFFSMKLVKGDTLAKLLLARKDPTDGLSRYLSTFESIAQTVAYAHARGVIHRDLKPSNVMVGAFGEVQVMDWGLAKVLPRGGLVDDAGAGKIPHEETVIATARSGSADSDLSRAGSVMGTPAYMAPEQARGEVDQVDERADVFALGSILCEILTGTPAFVGRTVGEIQRKAAVGDTADALARLGAGGLDADLVAIVRDCLARERHDRPASAGVVAKRVGAYLAGVQERLRKAELARVEERARRRLTTVAATALILLAGSGVGGYAWIERQKADRLARTARAVEEALADAARLRGEARSAPPNDSGRWQAALSAARRAEGLLASGEPDARLGDRVKSLLEGVESERSAAAEKARQIEVDRVLLAGLESARGGLVDHRDPRRTDAEYAEVFRKAGLDLDAAGPVDSGRWLASRTEPVEMAGYLDDWAFTRHRLGRPEPDWRRLVDAARRGDPDPWRDTIRARFAAADPGSVAEFRRMADDPKLEDQPAPGLLLLARQLKFGCDDRDRAAKVLRRAARRHSGDFRVHYELALAPGKDDGVSEIQFPLPEEAVRHLTTALGIRPASGTTHHLLAAAYLTYRKRAEAEAECREAIRLRPGDHVARAKLGEILRWAWKFEDAEAEGREAVRLQPSYAPAHVRLGVTLRDLWKLDEAAAELRVGIRLNRDDAGNYVELADILQRKADYAGAAAILREGRERGLAYNPGFFHPADWFAKADAWVALGARLPAVIRGEDRPKDQDERLDLAKMARQQGCFAASARLLADAMAEDPKIAEDRVNERRYAAACYAALAAVGKSRDDPPPDEAERARLRARALEWLRGDLATWAHYMEPGTPQVRMRVASIMTHWRLDGDLAGLRDPAALARLPQAERDDWQALWDEVAALLRKTGEAVTR